MASDVSTPDGQRLHPTSLIFRLITHARNLLLPGIAVIFLARGGEWQIWIAVLFVPSVLYEILRFITLRYRFAADELVIKEGLFFRNVRHIPFARIQNIDLVQSALHRLFRVTEVRLETASGTEPEAVLKVLSLGAVDEMRRRVFAGRAAGADHADGGGPPMAPTMASAAAAREAPGTVLLRLPTSELVKLGLISNRGFALFAVLLWLAWQLDLDERFELPDIRDGLESLAPALGSASGATYAASAVILVVVGLVVLYLASIGWTILRLHDFTLRRAGDDLRLSCGLLTKRSATVPRQRIQLVSVHEAILHRRFRRIRVRIETAGGSGEDDEERSFSRKWFVPLARWKDIPRLLQEIRPDLTITDVDWQPLAPKARRRMMKKCVIAALVPSAVVAALLFPWGCLSLLLFVPLGLWYAAAATRRMAWAKTSTGMLFRSGVLTRKLSATFHDKIQVVSLEQSPFDRRHRMAALRVDTAGAGPAGHRIRIPYLDAGLARRLLEDLAGRAQASLLRW